MSEVKYPPETKHITRLWGAAKALELAARKKPGIPLVVVAENRKQAELLKSELSFFLEHVPLLYYPEYAHEPFESLRIRPEIQAERASALKALLETPDFVLISTPYALAKRIPTPESYKENIITLKRGDICSPGELIRALDKAGYLAVEAVTGRGEFRFRGSLLDIFPISAELPLRLEYFDEEIESLFYYAPDTQKRQQEAESAYLLPASEALLETEELEYTEIPEEVKEQIRALGKVAGLHWQLPFVYADLSSPLDYLQKPFETALLTTGLGDLLERFYRSVEDRLPSEPYRAAFEEVTEFKARILSRLALILTDTSEGDEEAAACEGVGALFAFEKKNAYQALSSALNLLKTAHAEGAVTVIALESEKMLSLLKDFARDHELLVKDIRFFKEAKEKGVIYLYKERISGGFSRTVRGQKYIFANDEDIFGFARKRSRAAQKHEPFSTKFSELEEGDFVVHIDYGIGIYQGLRHLTLGGLEGDYLEILYEYKELLYVPLSEIGLIQKYIGVGDRKPPIASLRSASWLKLKSQAKTHAQKIAQDLLKLYAERKARTGFAFLGGEEELSEFESHFPYDETDDQRAAIQDVYTDMSSVSPMERLICGDVGFGKTEVAMRAAFKSAIAGKQTAVLVPTTVLARQHFLTFTERFKEFPITIDYISRFRSTKEIKKVCERLLKGEIDILIGTHRILSSDVQFKELRLLVIDEEQRFGVAHKEKISAMRSNIDVLSLSATPIPRTLQMSISGLRDMSIIETPPLDRQAVSVKVISDTAEIAKAVRTELAQGGQVFFLHNRIADIASVYEMLQGLVPEAKIRVAHGQTPKGELDKILKAFYEGETDILIATSIIENGIDIPNVNLIIIDDADKLGLSQLYQLKGRVGRGKRRGYCCLYVDNLNGVTPVAKKRLSIIQQLSELGSGLKIATYDLSLRGAGDFLGAAQSGFAVKVGYELFINMISQAVAGFADLVNTELTAQFPHYISADYIEDPTLRLEYYRRFSQVWDERGMEELFHELKSGYGPVSEETINLGYVMLIKNAAVSLAIKGVNLYGKYAAFTFTGASPVTPEKLTKAAGALKVIYRFAGEYEFTASFEKDTLKSAYGFLSYLLK